MSSVAKLSTRVGLAVCLAASFLSAEVSAISLNPTFDSWIRAEDAGATLATRDDDFISVWNSEVRYGVVEFDLSSIGVPITEVHLQLWNQTNGFSDDTVPIKQSSTLIAVVGSTSAVDWTTINTLIGSGTALNTLGAVDIPNAASNPLFNSVFINSSGNAADVAAVEAIRNGSDKLTIVMIADDISGGTTYKNSWGDAFNTTAANLIINEPIPLTPSVLELHINRFTGLTRILSTDGEADVDMDGYIMESFPLTSGRQSVWIPAKWNSLTDQNESGWVETPPDVNGSVTEEQALSELNLFSFKAIVAGESVPLGNVYDVSVGEQAVVFSYTENGVVGSNNGNVVFEGDGLRLRVAKATGRTDIVNSEAASINFESYSIQSPNNELDTVGWNSLEDQNVTGWQESNPTSSSLIELNLSSSTAVPAFGALVLGNGYSGGAGGNETVTFNFDLLGPGGIFSGVVEYLLLGDMNGDGNVDTADAALLVQALINRATYDANEFTTLSGFLVDADASGDINGDGRLDLGDLGPFSALLGGPASASAVPEPSSLALIFLAMAGLLARPNRR